MSEREKQEVVRERRNPYAEEQDEYGNSISTLRLNLKLTPHRRLDMAQQTLDSLLELKRPLKKLD